SLLLVSLYLGRRLTACPRLLNCPALSAQISCPGRLAGMAGVLASPMPTWQGMKLCRPYRAECFIRGLIPGAAPDGLPQAIELSCAFSADLVSRAPRWDGGRPQCSCDKHEEQKESYVRPLVRQQCRSLTKSGIPPTTRKSALLPPRVTNPSALQALYNPKAWDEPKATSQETDVKLKILS